MNDSMLAFDRILHSRLVPDYCEGAFLKSVAAEFKPTKILFSEEDAKNFVSAWEAGILKYIGGGKYKADRNGSAEKFFNSGQKSSVPRTFTLAQESVITVGVLARLHFEFKWPRDQIGTQSTDHSFDVVAFLTLAADEHIACEVKKSLAELDSMISDMKEFCTFSQLSNESLTLSNLKMNSMKKIRGLWKRRAPIFWAVGPGGLSRVFAVTYHDDRITLSEVGEAALMCPVERRIARVSPPPLTDPAILTLARALGLTRAADAYPDEVIAAARSVEALRRDFVHPVDPELAP